MANAGAEAWDRWCGTLLESNWPEFKDARDKMRISLASNYDELTEDDRSAFAYSVQDRIKWKANGMAVKKKGKRK